MKIGCKWRVDISSMLLDETQIAWVNDIKYLGMVLKSGANFQVDCTYEGRSINKLQNGIILLIFKI